MDNSLPILTKTELYDLLNGFVIKLKELLGTHLNDVILYGSYARNEAEEGSDIDVMILVDLPENEILKIRDEIYNFASDILYEKSILVSTIIHNKELFITRSGFVPFFRNVIQEGIKINVA
jgi:predicted nucleotidyltransferase